MKKFLILICLLFITTNVYAKEIEDLFNEVAPNDIFTINAFKPVCNGDDGEGNLWCGELDFYPTHYMRMKYSDDVYYAELRECNDELTECTLNIDIPGDEENDGVHDSKKVKVVWQESIPKVQEKLDLYANNVKYNTNKDEMGFSIYDITDLNLINYMYNTKNYNKGNGFNLVANYAKSLRKEFENSNLTYYMDIRLGDDYEMYNYVGGELVLMYDDIMGKLVPVGIQYKNVIYIPDDIENTPEAYIEAAKKRIEDYLGSSVKIEKVGKRSELVPETHEDPFDFSLLGDEDKMGEYYYKITVNNNSDYFVIVSDSNKIEKVETISTDILTNVTVSTTDPTVPVDTTIKVNEVEEKSDEYKKIIEFFNQVKFRAFNISLHSNDRGIIVRLENGKFKIVIPFGKDYIGKKLKAYFIKDDNSKEEYNVVLDENGNASFETAHFSTYIIAEELEEEKTNEEKLPDEVEKQVDETKAEEKTNEIVEETDKVNEAVPKTFDSIDYYIILLVVSIMGVGLALVLKKRFN